MAEIKDKIVTVESLAAVHEHISNTKFDKPENNIIPISNGGTGASTVAEVLTNLGIADYIVEQGVSGMWTYEKWASGKAKCRGSISYISGLKETEEGNASNIYIPYVYHTNNFVDCVDYPFAFVERPLEIVDAKCESTSCKAITYDESFINTITKTASYRVINTKNFNGDETIYLDYIVEGKWK